MSFPQQIMRFDLDARLEIFVGRDELEYDDRFIAIKKSDKTEDEKIAAAKELAAVIAQEMLEEKRVQITAYPRVSDVNIDRIYWSDMLVVDEDEVEAEAEIAAERTAQLATA